MQWDIALLPSIPAIGGMALGFCVGIGMELWSMPCIPAMASGFVAGSGGDMPFMPAIAA